MPHFAMYRATIAIPPQKRARNSFAILSLQLSRDMKSIAIGPLSSVALNVATLKAHVFVMARIPQSKSEANLFCKTRAKVKAKF